MNQESFAHNDQGLIDYLAQFITAHKMQVMEKVLAQRTRHFTVVLEDIYKPHNSSAVLRSCDCFGIQDVHIIEKTREYKVNPFVTRGASQWLTLHKYFQPEESENAVLNCFSRLKSNGFKIYGTSPDPQANPIQDLDPNEKIALVFGNEHEGISEDVKNAADGLVHIPMRGFTESLNISVAASLFLQNLVQKADNCVIPNYYLTEDEKQELRLTWYKSIVKNSDLHERKYLDGKE